MTTLIDIRLPHMGSVERAVITAWHKTAGDKVAVDDPLLDVSTDKVDTEVPSPSEGTLVRVLAEAGQEVPVGEVIAQFAPAQATAEEVAAALGRAVQEAPVRESDVTAPVVTTPRAPAAEAFAVSPLPEQDVRGVSLVLGAALRHLTAPAIHRPRPATSPLVRRMAKEAGIDLGDVTGSGPGGRVTRTDVQRYLDVASQTPPVRRDTPADAPTVPEPTATNTASCPDGYQDLPHEAVPHSPIRKAIAAHMVDSVSTAPQLTAQVDVDFSRVMAAREETNAGRAGRGLGKLSLLPFVARAAVAMLRDHPDVNGTFTDTHLLRWGPVNLGIAVDADSGLYVPVIRNAQRLSLEGLADAIADLSERARGRKLTAQDLAQGTFTISNSGSVGGVISTPILTRPQIASLGVPAVVRQPVAVRGKDGEEYVAIRPVARLGLTFDHRAMDGSDALRALLSIQRNLQEWPAEAYR
ncbi:dihydrolipoamide acetyltransferase family protein [Streptomyces malaysiensis]|uniref:Dihydrolipoamide acetyltransferase component of pyruvate dehydrogenase complex n=1 Tax=Streptomyces malaysiensis TaxID=92644 RepID=A0A7X5X088_STRMQ|nr:dihydrolipoamide acetyltransferase family protein [Streptomyces malaysiensis]NIY64258.1 hypothetical protein [Streptomyces malaysiensis]